jgi:hypothetical protein
LPSPVGHAIAGLCVHVACARDEGELLDLRRAGFVVGSALLPDVDLLFKLVDGRNHHQQETHSLGFALLWAFAALALARLSKYPRALALSCAAGLAWLSHVFLDYLNRDTNPPIGLMALWPLRDDYYKFPWPIFLDVGRSLTWETFGKNALAAAWETVVLLPVFSLVWRIRSKRFGSG